jgi:hypothetical protein
MLRSLVIIHQHFGAEIASLEERHCSLFEHPKFQRHQSALHHAAVVNQCYCTKKLFDENYPPEIITTESIYRQEIVVQGII